MARSRLSEAVLITGCSSGIGRATAEHLAHGGRTVYATARNPETISDLERRGCRLLALDVTDEDSMWGAVEEVERAEGAVGVLVNNAGYSQSGPIETVPMEQVRRQFETNVFGLSRMCQLVLPGMRRQGWGRIVNISSMGGKLIFPGGRLLPRHQTRRGGDQRRVVLRGGRLRGGGDRCGAGAHPHRLRRRLGGGRPLARRLQLKIRPACTHNPW
jgi:NAD(P)-dependent dehydrogenase (short-subunit alcohol dehydrogenase family)